MERLAESWLVRYTVVLIVTTFGSPWWLNNLYVRNPNRTLFLRGIRRLVSPQARTLWLARYGMDYIDKAARERFLQRVRSKMLEF